ncbi:putative Gaa1 like GPI transamidase component [Trypanosoma vivax]|uniref:Putative GPI transamidase component GAA1 n=1 Tax=Trypanosoma vivax (strain Y486) TaxID=1055687 RepID=G0U513_TRYVY|nr:putative Gaa1 like GPI transamidase component [Trypanosoma vivax]CCC50959.1 putative GPI transamidase component GAA1 [Trypanosoma vivax Y486]
MYESHTQLFLKQHASKGTPVLVLAGILLIALVPAVVPKDTFIDENAINVYSVPVVTPRQVKLRPNKTIPSTHRVVRGRRSVGSEAIAVYIDAASESSVILANHLISALLKRENMACDTHFYFVKGDAEVWPIPDIFVRAALVLNVSSLTAGDLCFGVYGQNGMQPNQDLLNLAVMLAGKYNLEADVLCQNPYAKYSTSRSKYYHYLLALQTALVAPQRPAPWHGFRSHGISLLSISTPESGAEDGAFSENTIVSALEQILATLSYLHERFHHSTSVWVPLSPAQYVEYDILQFGIMAMAASLLSTCYSIFECEGLHLTPCASLVCLTAIVARFATEQLGSSGFIMSSIFMTVALSTFAWDMSWLAINTVVMGLLIILQPVAGLVIGTGVALQLMFLHVKCRKFLVLFVGAISSWAVLYFLVHIVHLEMFDLKTTAGIYLTFFAYPNAVWLSSRLARSVLF